MADFSYSRIDKRSICKIVYDGLQLCSAFFAFYGGDIVDYMSISEAAAKWNVSNRRIQVLCAQKRIPGVCRIGNVWAIPKDAEKPLDARIKSGKFCKKENKGAKSQAASTL